MEQGASDPTQPRTAPTRKASTRVAFHMCEASAEVVVHMGLCTRIR